MTEQDPLEPQKDDAPSVGGISIERPGFGSPVRLLLVESEPSGQESVGSIIASAPGVQFDISPAGTLAEAVELARTAPFDVVLLDLTLPDSEGPGTLAELKRAAPLVPVVVLTERQTESIAREALSQGANDYLIKGPGTNSDLIVRSIRYAVEQKRASDALAESKRAEQALRQSEERYRQMFERNHAIKLLIDPDTGRIIEANPAASRYYGYPGDTLRGMKISDINTLSEQALAIEMESALSERRSYFNFRHRLASGDMRDVEVHSSPMELGGKLLLYSIVHDITDRKRAEEEIIKLNSDLENRVIERTAQIEEANRELERQIAERGRLEQEVRRHAEQTEAERTRLAYILEQLPVGVYIGEGEPQSKTVEWRFINQAGKSLMLAGQDIEVSSANQRYEVFHPDGSTIEDDEIAIINIVRYGAKAASNESLIRYADGQEQYLHSQAVLLNQNGEKREVLAVVQDITVRKRLEERVRRQSEAIRAEYERLAALVASVDIGISLLDTAGRIVLVNDAWVAISGLARDEVLGHRYDELGDRPPAYAETQAACDRVLETGETYRVRELYIQSELYPGGAFFDRTLVPMKDASGQIAGVLGATVNVTEKVRARQAVEAQRAVLENVIDGVPVCIAYCDRNLKILDLNAQWANLIGATPEEGKGKSILDVLPITPERADIYDQVLQGEAVDVQDFAYRPPRERATRYYDVYLRPMRDNTGAISGLLSALIDSTERHELDRRKDEFIALASHELKTPITTIKGFSQMALRQLGQIEPEKLGRMLGTINDQSDRLTRLVTELLDVSRVQSGQLVLEKETFDLRELLRDCLGSQQLSAPDFSLELDLPTEPILIHADRQRIEQVFVNLVQNAIKYSGTSKEVLVGLSLEGNEARTSVRDFGLGIPKEQQNRIFERFFRATNARQKNTGLGLGLFISENIVERHGGRMWMQSQEGEGSTFFFTLPTV